MRGSRRDRACQPAAEPSDSSDTARRTVGEISAGGVPNPPVEQRSQLVDHRLVALGREDVHERLRGKHLADRRGERRPARLGPDLLELGDHLVEPVAGALRPEVQVDRGDEPGGKAVLRRARRDPRGKRSDGLVADVLVDEIGGVPELSGGHAGVEAEAGERARDSFARGSMEDERDRVDGGGDQVGAGPGRLDRRGKGAASRALAVQADGEVARLTDRLDQLADAMRLERPGRVVDQHAGCAELGKALGLGDERLDLSGRACAVHEARIEFSLGGSDRLARLPQVRERR